MVLYGIVCLFGVVCLALLVQFVNFFVESTECAVNDAQQSERMIKLFNNVLRSQGKGDGKWAWSCRTEDRLNTQTDRATELWCGGAHLWHVPKSGTRAQHIESSRKSGMPLCTRATFHPLILNSHY